jgi:hypothetical protein
MFKNLYCHYKYFDTINQISRLSNLHYISNQKQIQRWIIIQKI